MDHDHIIRLANGDDRPFFDKDFMQMLQVLREEDDDVFIVLALVCECKIRVRSNPKSKAQRVLDEATPILKELVEFTFPDEPDALPGEGDFGDAVAWPQEGLLSVMGYHVGLEDPGDSRRREILTQVFGGPLARAVSPEYMAQWGRDKTVARLSKLAWSITTFANNRLRSLDGVPDRAVETWDADRHWLKKTFYLGHFSFPWPEIDY